MVQHLKFDGMDHSTVITTLIVVNEAQDPVGMLRAMMLAWPFEVLVRFYDALWTMRSKNEYVAGWTSNIVHEARLVCESAIATSWINWAITRLSTGKDIFVPCYHWYKEGPQSEGNGVRDAIRVALAETMKATSAALNAERGKPVGDDPVQQAVVRTRTKDLSTRLEVLMKCAQDVLPIYDYAPTPMHLPCLRDE